MAGVMPQTYQEQLMKLLASISTAKAAPDANLDELSNLEAQILGSIRKPFDTPVENSPVPGAVTNLSNGAQPPSGAAPGSLPPMIQALLAQQAQGGGAPAPGAAPAGLPAGLPAAPGGAPGTFPTRGLMASAGPPNMDEVRRMLTLGK